MFWASENDSGRILSQSKTTNTMSLEANRGSEGTESLKPPQSHVTSGLRNSHQAPSPKDLTISPKSAILGPAFYKAPGPVGDIYLIHKQISIPNPETGWGEFTFFDENPTEIIKLRILSWRGCSGLSGWTHPQSPYKYHHTGETKGKDPDKRGQGDSMKQGEKRTSQRLWQMPEGMSPTVSRKQGLAGSFISHSWLPVPWKDTFLCFKAT